MAKFRFTKETSRRVTVIDLYEIDADSYEDALRKLGDEDMDIDKVGKHISTDIEYNDPSYRDYSVIKDSDGEEIE